MRTDKMDPYIVPTAIGLEWLQKKWISLVAPEFIWSDND